MFSPQSDCNINNSVFCYILNKPFSADKTFFLHKAKIMPHYSFVEGLCFLFKSVKLLHDQISYLLTAFR